MITSKEFVKRLTEVPQQYKTYYATGTFGQRATDSFINAKAKQFPKQYTAAKVAKLKSLPDDTRLFDCCGLIKAILWNFPNTVYTSNGVSDLSDAGLYNVCIEKTTDLKKVPVGGLLHMPGHVGIKISETQAIDCSTKWNCVKINDLFRCVTSKEEFSAKSIILDLGNGFFTPNKLEIIGGDHINVSYKVSKNYHDYDNKDVIVLGGGDSAVDFANDIKTKSSARVTIIHRRDVFRANGENVKELTKNNVNIILNANLEKIEDNFLYFENKTDNSKQKIHFDTIIVQYGQKINTDLPAVYKSIKHNEFGKFIVDRYQQTNIENVYAVGNCCFYPNRGNLIVVGHGEAAVAVLEILRKLKKYEEHKVA
ncbi:MAG: NAD(P)/FAD-dependent oxidoreductase [Bacilli bacterium]|nr:NAD(P)/FAD-dependent oxidoreductase [Bacilli bacterium]